MDYRSILFVFCLMCSIIAAEGIDVDKKNPIINLFEAPLHAFKTEPGEAIAVFEPQLVRQANDNSSISSWFQAGQNIGSAAGAITGWIRNRISSTSTTREPEVIVQVHQVERPKPVENNGLDSIRLGPNNNIAKRKKQKQQQQAIDDEIEDEIDSIEEQINNYSDNNNDDIDDDDDDSQVNDYQDNKRPKHRKRIDKDRDGNRDGTRDGYRKRNFNNNLKYDYVDDDDDDDDYDDDDDSYRDGYESDNDDDDDDDDDNEVYYSYANANGIRRRGPVVNGVNYNRIQPNRRPIQYLNNANQPPPNRRIQQNEFYRPFQDMPPLAKPVRYGPNNNNFQPQAIGVLKQKQIMQRRKQQQLQQQQQKQKLQQQQQQQQNSQQETQQQNQKEQQNRPQHLDLLLNGQNHVLIPVQVVPNSIPYQQILPQIQVVAQHHHTIEQQTTDEPATTVQPNRRTKRPHKRRPEQNFDQDRRPSRRTTTPRTTRRTTTTRRPSRSTRTTRRTTTTTTTTPMPAKFPEKGNKFEINRRKPVAFRSDTPEAMPDNNRPDPLPPQRTGEEEQEEAEEEMSQYKPPEPVMDEVRIDEENDEDDFDKVEGKSGEARSQYFLPQRYYKILGSNSYLALNNNGRFLLRTGRNANPDEKNVVIKLADNVKIDETNKNEKLVDAAESLTKPVVEDSPKTTQSDTKVETEKPKLPVTQVKTTEENVTKDVKVNDKDIKVDVKEDTKVEVKEKVNESTPFTATTESPLKVEKENSTVIKDQLIPVEMITKPTEKVILRSEVVQEKQNGNLIIKSENAATLPKVEPISIEKYEPPKETLKETS